MNPREADRAAAERIINVSRETWGRLERLVAALDRWQATTNLVASSTLEAVWTRHIVDSAQLVALAPDAATVWVDFGSGAGFPGLVVAAQRPDMRFHLVESNGKKAAFLREAARAMGVEVLIHGARVEAVVGSAVTSADVVSARALAPLDDLVRMAAPLLKTGAIGLFPKGREAQSELTVTAKSWTVETSLHPSLTEPDARIVRIERFLGPR